MPAVQLRWEATRSERELHEAPPGGNPHQDGGPRQGIHEGQAEGEFILDHYKFDYLNHNLT